jgi:hypothetical protein
MHRLMNAASDNPVFLASTVGWVSRFGPMVPVAAAGVNVWHVAQPPEAKTALPAAALPPPDGVVVVPAEVVVAADVVAAAELVPAVTVCTTVAGGFPSEV